MMYGKTTMNIILNVILAIFLLISTTLAADNIILTPTNTIGGFYITIYDGAGNPSRGVLIGNITMYWSCNGTVAVAFNQTGDTLVEISSTVDPGTYFYTSNDVLSGCSPGTLEVTGYGGQRSVVKRTFLISIVRQGQLERTICQITAAVSGSSFTIGGPCKDSSGQNITLLTDIFVGSYMIAITRGSTQCNVVGHGVFVEDVTSGGIVTIRTSDMPGSGFPSTPNTSNCDVEVRP